MAMVNEETQCNDCGNNDDTFKCQGCLQYFCFEHLSEHRRLNMEELNRIEDARETILRTFTEQKTDPKTNSLIEQINQWEQDSIIKIKQTSEKFRQILIKYTNKYLDQMENKFNNLTKEMKKARHEQKFNEKHLNLFTQKLSELEKELHQLTYCSIEQDSESLIDKIYVLVPYDSDTKWKQDAITVVGGNGFGDDIDQLSHSRGIFIDDEETIYIADTLNNRIIEKQYSDSDKDILGYNDELLDQINQLNGPTDVAVDKENDFLIVADSKNRRVMLFSSRNRKNGESIIEDIDCSGLAIDMDGYLYVSDYKKNEVRRWIIGDEDGTVVAGGNGQGNNLNQLDSPDYIFVDKDGSLYISDRNNHRIVKWVKNVQEGTLVAAGNGKGESLNQLCHPRGVFVDNLGQIFVADWGNNRIMRWVEGSTEGTIIVGGNGYGDEANQFRNPYDLAFDRKNNLYVSDCYNHRVQKFDIDFN